MSHVFNTITNFDKMNFPINEIHWIALNFHHHGTDFGRTGSGKIFFLDQIMWWQKNHVSKRPSFIIIAVEKTSALKMVKSQNGHVS